MNLIRIDGIIVTAAESYQDFVAIFTRYAVRPCLMDYYEYGEHIHDFKRIFLGPNRYEAQADAAFKQLRGVIDDIPELQRREITDFLLSKNL